MTISSALFASYLYSSSTEWWSW